MGEKKVATMVLKVDLDCDKCRKRVKKALFRTPGVQDQVWDEKKNTVTIRVLVCCTPENIKDSISYKGGDSIKGIEIIVPKPPEKPKEVDQKTKEPAGKPKESEKAQAQAPAPAPAPAPNPVQQVLQPVGYAQAVQAYPIGTCCCSYPHCYGGVPGGPYGYGQGGPPVPSPQYYYQYDGGYIGRPVYDSYGNGSGGRGYYVNRSDYLSEENQQGCSIM